MSYKAASVSKVGDRKAYEGNDQEQYSSAQVADAYAKSTINPAGYKDQTAILNELNDQENQRKIDERHKHDPTYTAAVHGNKPSRGAQIDAELQDEEAAMLDKKNNRGRSDGVVGKQMAPGTSKSERRQELDAEVYAERKAHSKSGANTGQHGMEYIRRKN